MPVIHSSEEEGIVNEERQEIQNTRYFTPLAATPASRNTYGDSNDQIEDLIGVYYYLGHAPKFEHGIVTRGDMVRAQTDHLNTVGQNTGFTFEVTNYDCNGAPQLA